MLEFYSDESREMRKQASTDAAWLFYDGLSLSNRSQNPTISVKPKRKVVGNTEGSRLVRG